MRNTTTSHTSHTPRTAPTTRRFGVVAAGALLALSLCFLTACAGPRPAAAIASARDLALPALVDQAMVADQQQRFAAALEACHHDGMARGEVLGEASLGVSLTVAATGEVEQVQVTPAVDTDFVRCVANVVGQFRFPVQTRQRVELPVAFYADTPSSPVQMVARR